jgi:hypothetical protein
MRYLNATEPDFHRPVVELHRLQGQDIWPDQALHDVQHPRVQQELPHAQAVSPGPRAGLWHPGIGSYPTVTSHYFTVSSTA